MNARTLLVSSFSEDDNAVYFALLDNGTAEVFSALKNNSEPAAKIADHRLPESASLTCLPALRCSTASGTGSTLYT